MVIQKQLPGLTFPVRIKLECADEKKNELFYSRDCGEYIHSVNSARRMLIPFTQNGIKNFAKFRRVCFQVFFHEVCL